jgi:hypothetical protein
MKSDFVTLPLLYIMSMHKRFGVANDSILVCNTQNGITPLVGILRVLQIGIRAIGYSELNFSKSKPEEFSL